MNFHKQGCSISTYISRYSRSMGQPAMDVSDDPELLRLLNAIKAVTQIHAPRSDYAEPNANQKPVVVWRRIPSMRVIAFPVPRIKTTTLGAAARKNTVCWRCRSRGAVGHDGPEPQALWTARRFVRCPSGLRPADVADGSRSGIECAPGRAGNRGKGSRRAREWAWSRSGGGRLRPVAGDQCDPRPSEWTA